MSGAYENSMAEYPARAFQTNFAETTGSFDNVKPEMIRPNSLMENQIQHKTPYIQATKLTPFKTNE